MSGQLRLAVVGAGLIGERHARLAVKHDRWTLAALVDPYPQKAALAQELDCLHVSSIEDLPQHGVDAVVLATPNSLHLAGGLACAERGWPCLIEKPIADTTDSGLRLVEGFEKANVPLLIGHHRRYHPFVKRARHALETGEFGGPVMASLIWAVRKPPEYFLQGDWRLRSDGGPLLINLIHEMDLVLHLFGPIRELQAMTSNAQRGALVEDTAGVLLRFESGLVATICLSDAALSPWSFEGACGENPHIAETGISSWRIGCSNGAIELPGLEVWQDAEQGEGDWSRPLVQSKLQVPKVTPLEEQLTHFADLAEGRASAPMVSGRDGLAALTAIVAIQKAARTGEIIKL